ncbi:MAG TPA: GNAT family N-acetyltransferase [Bryobacteraceae bacterium]|mgnify:CR=1 FL=1|nr:GNAT family N-acetyltransferase [Bryobacteraceae bacterium]HOQ46399.1 GNAT family N-acetyltransferase [Bryobacteraceae bacterium]HPU72164.1 GNAT family N-acetyltransferase [Bryobacteraceae bacterium]
MTSVPSFEAMEENLRVTLGAFARAKPTGEVRNFPGITVCCSDVNFAMFNASVITAPVMNVAQLEERIATAAGYYRERGLPWSCWLCQEWIDKRVRSRVAGAFYRHGLHLVVELPGMEANRLAPPRRPLPQLVFRKVESSRDRADFTHLMAAAFGIPHSISREVYESAETWQSGLTGWLGYLEGEAVTSAATVIAGGVTGVYAVGTLPRFRRSGCAEAVMRHALAQAQQVSGIERSVLEASEQGYRLYEKMGYRTVARYAVFAYG